MNANKYEKMWADVRNAEYKLARTPMNDIIAYLHDHEWASVEEMGQNIYGIKYNDIHFKNSYACTIGAVMRKLVSFGYAEVKKVKKEDAKPIEIVKEDIEKIYLPDTVDISNLKKEGWTIQLFSYSFDGQVGIAWRKITIKKMIEPTVKKYHLIVKD